MPVGEFHPEHCVGQRLDHHALDLDGFFLRHILLQDESFRMNP